MKEYRKNSRQMKMPGHYLTGKLWIYSILIIILISAFFLTGCDCDWCDPTPAPTNLVSTNVPTEMPPTPTPPQIIFEPAEDNPDLAFPFAHSYFVLADDTLELEVVDGPLHGGRLCMKVTARDVAGGAVLVFSFPVHTTFPEQGFSFYIKKDAVLGEFKIELKDRNVPVKTNWYTAQGFATDTWIKVTITGYGPVDAVDISEMLFHFSGDGMLLIDGIIKPDFKKIVRPFRDTPTEPMEKIQGVAYDLNYRVFDFRKDLELMKKLELNTVNVYALDSLSTNDIQDFYGKARELGLKVITRLEYIPPGFNYLPEHADTILAYYQSLIEIGCSYNDVILYYAINNPLDVTAAPYWEPTSECTDGLVVCKEPAAVTDIKSRQQNYAGIFSQKLRVIDNSARTGFGIYYGWDAGLEGGWIYNQASVLDIEGIDYGYINLYAVADEIDGIKQPLSISDIPEILNQFSTVLARMTEDNAAGLRDKSIILETGLAVDAKNRNGLVNSEFDRWEIMASIEELINDYPIFLGTSYFMFNDRPDEGSWGLIDFWE